MEEQVSKQVQYEVVVIGAGPGGYVAAIKATQLGLDVAVVEQGDIGGTCLNRGCIPTKTLLHTAELYEEMERASMFGISVGEPSLDFDTLRSRKEEVCTNLREGVEQLLTANGVHIIRGRARVLSSTQVEVELSCEVGPEGDASSFERVKGAGEPVGQDTSDAQDETLIITTKNIIIASGTSPLIPQIEGADLPGVYTSDSLLAEVPSVKRLAVIGGGVIGMEFASVYTSFGSEVTVLVTSDYALRSLDRELGQSLSMEFKKKGAQVITRAVLTKIETVGEGAVQGQETAQDCSSTPLCLTYTVKDEEKTLDVDAVLLAKGRATELDGLFSSDLQPQIERGKIVVDEYMRTSVEGVYAIGDITDAGPELAHAASAEGIIAASHIAGEACTRRLDLVPNCIYTSPEIACVGLSEAEAKQQGLTVKTAKFPLAGNGKTLITAQGRSFIKIVTDEAEHVLGAQLMCARATDIIGELALGIAAGMTVSEMLEVVRPHPTFEEAVGEALELIEGNAIHSMPRKR